MAKNEITKRFFSLTDSKTKSSILQAVASHYGITEQAAEAEVTDPEAESLLDYLVGPIRTATHALMKRHNLA